ncbi:MAG: hypothetical protein KGH63_04920 [Candidatus Micrarchaeota archaeon]|nr:hypothetical protein [Candidatus Micrarchaeota archaeon]
MASTKMRALVSIARFAVGAGVGFGIYYFWTSIRTYDPWYYGVGAGLVTFVMAWLLLEKLKGGGD